MRHFGQLQSFCRRKQDAFRTNTEHLVRMVALPGTVPDRAAGFRSMRFTHMNLHTCYIQVGSVQTSNKFNVASQLRVGKVPKQSTHTLTAVTRRDRAGENSDTYSEDPSITQNVPKVALPEVDSGSASGTRGCTCRTEGAPLPPRKPRISPGGSPAKSATYFEII